MLRHASLWIVLGGLWPLIVLAGDDPDDRSAIPGPSVNVSVERTGRADIGGTGAAPGYTDYGAELEWGFALFEIDHRRYRWNDPELTGQADGDEPWRTLSRLSPGVRYYRQLDDQWAIWGQFIGIAGFEERISARSWTYNPQLVALRQLGDDLTLFAGAGTLHHPVDPVPYGVIGVAWGPGTRSGLSGIFGLPETSVRYRFDERFSLRAHFEWDVRTHRLADDNALAANGFVRTEDFAPGLSLEYQPARGVKVSVGARRMLDRELKVFDRDGDELIDLDVAPAWAFSVGAGLEF